MNLASKKNYFKCKDRSFTVIVSVTNDFDLVTNSQYFHL